LWNELWLSLRYLMVHKLRYFPALAIGSVVYEILDTLAHNLFLWIGRQDLTIPQLESALQRFRISENDPSFLRMYDQLEKEYDRSQRRVVIDDDEGNDNPSKKARLEKARLDKDKKKSDKDKSNKPPAGNDRTPGHCFGFLSQTGCSTVGCRFLHTPLTDAPAKKKKRIKELMVQKSLVPDDAKF
jgi:hypothetical protein